MAPVTKKCPVCGSDVTHTRFIFEGERYCNLLCFLKGKKSLADKKGNKAVRPQHPLDRFRTPSSVSPLTQGKPVHFKDVIEEVKKSNTIVSEKIEKPVEEQSQKVENKKEDVVKDVKTNNSPKTSTKKTTTKKKTTATKSVETDKK